MCAHTATIQEMTQASALKDTCEHTPPATCETHVDMLTKAEGLKAFLSLSFPRLILGNFGKKPFPEFLKAFPDLEND